RRWRCGDGYCLWNTIRERAKERYYWTHVHGWYEYFIGQGANCLSTKSIKFYYLFLFFVGAFALHDLENNTVRVHDLDSTHKIFGFSKLNFGGDRLHQRHHHPHHDDTDEH